MMNERPKYGIFRQSALLLGVAACLGLSGCAGLMEDWQLRQKAVSAGVDETATAEALVPRLPIVRFDLGETRPSAEAEEELRQAAEMLADLDPTQFVILVEGHTDATGPVDLNYEVAQQRAQSVADILIDEGVDPNLIQLDSFGPDLPVASNQLDDGEDHPRGRRFNRRVEVMIAPREEAGDDPVTASAS